MLRLIDEQLGRILLGLAVLVAVGAACLNPRKELPKVSEDSHRRAVQVPLDRNTLTAGSKEVFFLPDDGKGWAGTERPSFVQPIKVKEFTPVDLPLPPSAVMRPPQILPEPGPALEGTQKLPRYGEEFPPIGAPNAENKTGQNPPAVAVDPKAPKAGNPQVVPPGPAPDPKVPPKAGPPPPPEPGPPPKTPPSPRGRF